MAETTILVVLHPLEVEPIRDELCPRCWLPSLFRTTFAVTMGRCPIGLRIITLCVDCGALIEEAN